MAKQKASTLIFPSFYFRIDELFLQSTFENRCKQKLGIDTEQAKSIFKKCLASNQIHEVKKVGHAKFPAYSTGPEHDGINL